MADDNTIAGSAGGALKKIGTFTLNRFNPVKLSGLAATAGIAFGFPGLVIAAAPLEMAEEAASFADIEFDENSMLGNVGSMLATSLNQFFNAAAITLGGAGDMVMNADGGKILEHVGGIGDALTAGP